MEVYYRSSPILTSEGSKVRRVYGVAREMKIMINIAIILPAELW